jgi:hypothetical protein
VTPDWLGSPQHVVAGAALSLLAGLVARRRLRLGLMWAFAAAVTVTMAAEALVELGEYPLMYRHGAHATAYYDTIADLAATLAGALVGGLAAVLAGSRR